MQAALWGMWGARWQYRVYQGDVGCTAAMQDNAGCITTMQDAPAQGAQG